jgi:hypothetical protein
MDWVADIRGICRLRRVTHAFEAGRQILEVCLEIFGVHRLGHLIHAHGFIAFEQLITCP